MTEQAMSSVLLLQLYAPVVAILLLAVVRSTVLVGTSLLFVRIGGEWLGPRGRRAVWTAVTWGLFLVGVIAMRDALTSAAQGPQWTSDSIPAVPSLVYWLIWGVPGVVLASRVVLGWRFVHALLRSARPLDDARWETALRRCAGDLGLSRSPRIVCSSRIDSPVAVGLVRRTIVVPERILSVDESLRTAVLRHELEHIRSLDLWTWHVGLAARGLLWFSPGVWLAVRRCRLASEEVCDSAALVGSVSVSSYSTYLAELAGAVPRGTFDAVLARLGPHDLVVRLDGIRRLAMSSRRPAHPMLSWMIGVMLIVGSLLIALPAPEVVFRSGDSMPTRGVETVGARLSRGPVHVRDDHPASRRVSPEREHEEAAILDGEGVTVSIGADDEADVAVRGGLDGAEPERA